MIEIAEEFTVLSDAENIWGVISNPHLISACIPGATLEEQHDDGSYSGTLLVQFGPAKVIFRARLMLELDNAEKIGRITGRGKDRQGGTRIGIVMTFRVSAEDSGSRVAGNGEVEIAGRLAHMIEGGASVVVKRMSGEFIANLERRCASVSDAAPPPSQPGSERRISPWRLLWALLRPRKKRKPTVAA